MLATLKIGYGITVEPTPALEKAIEEQIDLEFILDDHFPILSMDNYGNTYEVKTLVLIKSSVAESDEYMLDLSATDRTITDEEAAELLKFCTQYDLNHNPQWMAFFAVF